MNEEAMCYVGNLSPDVSQEIIEELFIQVGPLKNVTVKKSETHNYALIEFEDEDSVPFAIEILDGIALFNKPIVVKPRNNTKQEEVWKKSCSSESRRASRDLNRSQSQPDSRRRDTCDSRYQENSNNTQRFHGARPPPIPPPVITNIISSNYEIQQSASQQIGYAPSFDRADRWHTPPSREHVTPRIPREFDPAYQQADRSNERYSRDSYRDDRRNSYQGRNRRDDYQANDRYGQENRRDFNRNRDRRASDYGNRRY